MIHCSLSLLDMIREGIMMEDVKTFKYLNEIGVEIGVEIWVGRTQKRN